MGVIIIFLLLSVCGFILFKKNTFTNNDEPAEGMRISVIIPARNEEKNLPALLQSLTNQSVKPLEIIVCDDHSEDATNRIAGRFGVTVVQSPPLPQNWTGKNWAVWNGFKKSSGDVLVFLDADVILKKRALETLVNTRAKTGGVISVVPFHQTVKFYERLSLILYLLGIFVFTSPFEKDNCERGLRGCCIAVRRTDYEKIGGHTSVSGEIVEDMKLGKQFVAAGINVQNRIGYGLMTIRMYQSLKEEIQGFVKGAVLSTSDTKLATMLFIVLWLVGLLASGFATPVLLILGSDYAIPFLAGYFFYSVQIIYFLKYIGRYGWIVPVFHTISSLFFVFVMVYATYRVTFIGSVNWKGREIKVGEKGK